MFLTATRLTGTDGAGSILPKEVLDGLHGYDDGSYLLG